MGDIEQFKSYTYVYSNHRREAGSGYDYGTEERIQSFEETLKSLIVYELGYGGQVIELTPSKIVVETRVLSKIDTVTFEATEDEMIPLLEAVRLWLKAESKSTIEDYHKRLIEKFGDGNGMIRPCLAVWGASLAKGEIIMGALQGKVG